MCGSSGNMFKMLKLMMSTILKNTEEIKAANVAKDLTMLTSKKSHVVDGMEKLLLLWINEKQLAGDIISERITYEKAKQLHSDIKKHTPGISAESDKFTGSRGFVKFRKRTVIHSAVVTGKLLVLMWRKLKSL